MKRHELSVDMVVIVQNRVSVVVAIPNNLFRQVLIKDVETDDWYQVSIRDIKPATEAQILAAKLQGLI